MSITPLHVSLPEGNIHIAVYGSQNKTPVILLHGTAAYHYCWRNVAAYLAQSYRVYCPDMLGAGFSDKPIDVPYSKRAQALRLISAIESLGYGPVHLAGHSLGGEVATHIALEAPHLIQSLMLIAPDGFRQGVIPPVRWAARKGWMNGMFRRAMRSQMKPKTLSRILALPLDRITPDFMENWTMPYTHPNTPDIIAKSLADDDTGVISDHVPQITLPSLLVYGTKDRMIPKRVFAKYQAHLPNVRTEIYEGYGHVLMEQCPERLSEAIDSFVKENL